MNFTSKNFLTAVFLIWTAVLFAGDFNSKTAVDMLVSARRTAVDFWSHPRAIDPESGYHIWINAKNEKEREPEKWGNPMAEALRVFYTHATAYSLAGTPQEKARIRKMLDYGMNYFAERRKAGNGVFPNKEKFDTVRRCIRQVNAVYMISDAAIFTGDRKIAEFAAGLFEEVCRKYYDPEHGGFFERLPEEKPPVRYKRLETQLLALSALNSLCKLYPQKRDYRQKLQDMFDILTNRKLYHNSGYPYEWYYSDFKPFTGKPMYDELQYGHAAENGWMICEAAETLGVADEKVTAILAPMAEALLREGADESGAARMVGSYSKGVPENDFDPFWWNSLELMNFSIYYYNVSGDKRFLDFYFKLGNYAFENFPLSDGVWTQVAKTSKLPRYRGGYMYKSGWHLTHAVTLQTRLLKDIIQ